MSQAIRRLARDLIAHAEWLALSGVEELPAGLEPADPPGGSAGVGTEARCAEAAGPDREAGGTTGGTDGARALGAVAGGTDGVGPSEESPGTVVAASRATPEPGPAADLAALRREIGDCTRCGLSQSRSKIVFGSGHPNARLVFVGEGPGRDEDRQGLPFVGRAGELLTDIIQKGMRIDRSEVYICNVVKCRPPGNRNPEPDEVAACSPFLARQIEIVRPEVIVALGKFAAQTLLRTTVPITQLRGHWHEYRGIAVMPTFHPAHLLRNPAYKRHVWEDIKKVMTRLGLPVS